MKMRPTKTSPASRLGRWPGRVIVGCFFLFTGGVHAGIVFADPATYRPFADEALFDFVTDGWTSVFMANPAFWGFGFWLWSVPALAVLITLARRDHARHVENVEILT